FRGLAVEEGGRLLLKPRRAGEKQPVIDGGEHVLRGKVELAQVLDDGFRYLPVTGRDLADGAALAADPRRLDAQVAGRVAEGRGEIEHPARGRLQDGGGIEKVLEM